MITHKQVHHRPKRGFRYWFKSVVKSPWLQCGVGVIMLFSSLHGQQGTLYTDLANFEIKVHHGVHFMGIWQILQALPNLLDSVSWIFNKWLDDD